MSQLVSNKVMYPRFAHADSNVGPLVDAALEAGGGVLHALPNFVHRDFCTPGRNLRLHPRDYYWLGAQLGFDERWFLSTMPAGNRVKVLFEGLTFILGPDNKRFLLADAVKDRPEALVGRPMFEACGTWGAYSKFFDNMNALPHHVHQDDAHGAAVKMNGKPESYFFPAEYNQHYSREGITFIGLRPGTTRAQVRQCLDLWGGDGFDIRHLSQGYLVKVDTGWLMPAGMLHAPAGVCTYEPQAFSDTFQMFQAQTSDGWLDRDGLLFKDIPADKKGSIDYMLDLLDWDLNVDGNFAQRHYLEPRLDEKRSHDGVSDEWVVFGPIGGSKGAHEEKFSAKKLTLMPGASTVLTDPGASGVFFMNGRGRIGKHEVDVPSMFRVGDVTYDEFFVSAAAARGTEITNTGKTRLVCLRYFGPNTHGAELPNPNK